MFLHCYSLTYTHKTFFSLAHVLVNGVTGHFAQSHAAEAFVLILEFVLMVIKVMMDVLVISYKSKIVFEE